MKNITRNIPTTTISVSYIDMSTGVPVLKKASDIIVVGEALDMAEAQKHVNKTSSIPLTVTKVTAEETLYKMSVDTFIKHSVKVDKNNEAE